MDDRWKDRGMDGQMGGLKGRGMDGWMDIKIYGWMGG